MTRTMHRAAPLAALILVNVFAVAGQAQWAYAHLGHNPWVAAGFAATLESISLFLTAEASKAMLNNDRAGTLRLGAYLVGVLVGAMNYAAHAGPDWHPTAMAIAFGLLSALSPWLWTIHTRGIHRTELRAAELIDPRTVKLPLMLWGLYPVRAFGMLRLAVWSGENRPGRVRAMYAERSALRNLDPADQVRYAFGALGHYEPHAARVWLQARGVLVDTAALDLATAGRPASPVASVPVPVSPAGPAAGQLDLAGPEYHRAQLDALPTNRSRIRYAFAVLGQANPPDAVRWLATRGITVQRSEAYAVARSTDTPTGEQPTVPRPVPAPPVPAVNGHRPTLAAVPS